MRRAAATTTTGWAWAAAWREAPTMMTLGTEGGLTERDLHIFTIMGQNHAFVSKAVKHEYSGKTGTPCTACVK